MERIQQGNGAALRICPYFPDGRNADLRFSAGILPYLVKPDGDSVPLRKGVRYNERTQDIVVDLPASVLKELGAYSVILNTRLGRVVWASAAVRFAEVVEEGGQTSGPLAPIVLVVRLDLLDYPSNVVVTGASPRIGEGGTWLCWDDSMMCYVDTGVAAGAGEGGWTVSEITAAQVDALWDATE